MGTSNSAHRACVQRAAMGASNSNHRTAASSSSFSRRSNSWKYEVFLSFRGDDTRNTFTDHLFIALRNAGINTFIDYQLRKGKNIQRELDREIEESRIAVVIFSKRYAESRWCLRELSKIMRCREVQKGKIVYPIFYNVDPSQVRKQNGSFSKAFRKHKKNEDPNEVKQWRKDLKASANFGGRNLKTTADGFADTKEGRYNPKMHPAIPVHNWREGSQRKSSPEFWRDRPIPADTSKEHNCIPEEHYVQTLLAQEGLEGELTRRSLIHTSWDLSSSRDRERRGWHPMTYKYSDATPMLIGSIKEIYNVYYETEYRREWCSSKGKPSRCLLFARKFTRPAALRLLNTTALELNRSND